MKYEYGKTSLKRLNTCHSDLIRLANRMLEKSKCDLAIICGTRNEEEQEKAFSLGNSQARFGESPHNFDPSRACDIAPYVNGIPWGADSIHYYLWDYIGELAKECAEELDIEITWGGDFKSIIDKPHIELKNWKEM